MIPAVKNAGYDVLIITDHYRRDLFEGISDPSEIGKKHLEGYYKAKKIGESAGLRVFPAMEMCLAGTREDFLVYGMEEEDFYRLPPLWDMSQKEVFEYCDERGWLLIQAHPFRPYLEVKNPRYMHGIEVYNGNPRHDSHNGDAARFAEINNLPATSGSDYHQEGDEGRGGMVFEEEINTMRDFVKAVKSKNYSLIGSDSSPEPTIDKGDKNE